MQRRALLPAAAWRIKYYYILEKSVAWFQFAAAARRRHPDYGACQ
jgi:hypothetical protein